MPAQCVDSNWRKSGMIVIAKSIGELLCRRGDCPPILRAPFVDRWKPIVGDCDGCFLCSPSAIRWVRPDVPSRSAIPSRLRGDFAQPHRNQQWFAAARLLPAGERDFQRSGADAGQHLFPRSILRHSSSQSKVTVQRDHSWTHRMPPGPADGDPIAQDRCRVASICMAARRNKNLERGPGSASPSMRTNSVGLERGSTLAASFSPARRATATRILLLRSKGHALPTIIRGSTSRYSNFVAALPRKSLRSGCPLIREINPCSIAAHPSQ